MEKVGKEVKYLFLADIVTLECNFHNQLEMVGKVIILLLSGSFFRTRQWLGFFNNVIS